MNTQISFNTKVCAPDSVIYTDFSVVVAPEGAVVKFDHRDIATLPWDKIEDVEYLSSVLWGLKVWEFRIVVELLADMIKTPVYKQELKV